MRIRPTARIIVLDPDDRTLLFKYQDERVFDPNDPLGADQVRTFWVPPGGGLEPGETYEEAAQRELFEETGFRVTVIGPCVMERDKLLHVDDEPVLFREQLFVVRVEETTISADGWSDIERETTLDHRWWSLADLQQTDEVIFPENLIGVLERVPGGTPLIG